MVARFLYIPQYGYGRDGYGRSDGRSDGYYDRDGYWHSY